MPLRDHFRPPLDNEISWEQFHSQWPAVIVQHLRKILPPGYVAGPRVHLGSQVEIDVGTFEKDDPPSVPWTGDEAGGAAAAVWAPPTPSVSVETMLPDFDEYEVRIYNANRRRHLVAAIEIVSPANKDRPGSRNVFVAKCAALLQNGVAVSIIDLVTIRQFNLYAELLELIGHDDPTLGDKPPPIYAISCRWREQGKRKMLEAWSHALTLGKTLPTLPLWLNADLVVPLDLEPSYEQACRDLWID